ncbi:hypothetical protein [Carboxylicivirga taeanensis]|uniref:hypothetical protein n=1 Tax=Carboxylicivirga taeanensis TaxID=1416875 RepID=UPI003F6E22F8
MKKRSIILSYFLPLLFIVIGCKHYKERLVTVESLLKEMTDRDGLAKLAPIPFKTFQASSYSRKSTSPEQEGWFDNADASQLVRVDTTEGHIEYVLMNVDGSGAIIRFWS